MSLSGQKKTKSKKTASRGLSTSAPNARTARARPGSTIQGPTGKQSSPAKTRGKAAGRDYHVGNLDEILVEKGAELLRKDGLHDLSLRKVAREAGVSHTAAYRHFDDKDALLAAIARDGFHRLHAYQSQAIRISGADFNLRFLNLGWTYVKFALENPEYARIMYGGAGLNFKDYTALASASRKSYRELLMSVRLCQKSSLISPGRSRQKTLAAWSIVHGLSMLLLDGQFPAPASPAVSSRKNPAGPEKRSASERSRAGMEMETMVKDIIVNLYYGLKS